MNHLPDLPARQPHAPKAGHPTINPAALEFLHDVEEALAAATPEPPKATSFRDDTPLPATGPTPPVPQPGRPPMSSKATDDSVRMISAGFLTLCAGGAASGVLHFSSHADPTTLALIAAAPIGIAVPILALTRLLRGAKEAAAALPAEHHHHYTGTVIQDQRSINTQTRGVWASTRNQLPR
ncbi:hypothetical protein [Streptomyces lavendofoliae]|uniref:Uncharacterized protein n=1 Tax=Streptomyces lavendofoliae TaxID=67314 RepID=A0A918I4I9_9ACTN|nr:hypothetical protein [Streptomyces lavendofoliae]GGU62630.1 hypothetical protein GCM10010274_59290 [Streptomyces lavendofoliae]